MVINSVDIKSFGAELVDKKIGTAEFIATHDWIRNSYSPMLLNKENKYTPIQCIFVVKAITMQELEEKTSHFFKKIEECTLKFDDIDFYYDCYLQNKSNEYIGNNIGDGMETQRIEVMFVSGFKYKPQISETMNRITSKTLNIAGNTETPAIVEITPSIDTIDLVLTGLSDGPITIENLTGGKKVILNGEDGTVIVDGVNKFGDTDLWEFPRLKPGNNTITVNRNNVDINIKYNPRWI